MRPLVYMLVFALTLLGCVDRVEREPLPTNATCAQIANRAIDECLYGDNPCHHKALVNFQQCMADRGTPVRMLEKAN